MKINKTRGRGFTDSALFRWTVSMLCLQQICEQVEVFTEVSLQTSEQHVDMRPARVSRDNEDIKKLRAWLHEHPPFLDSKEIVSLSTGEIGNEEINCRTARAIGITCMEKIVGQTFERIHLKQKAKVKTLASINCSLKVADKKITVYPLTLFQRVCIVKQTNKISNSFFVRTSPFSHVTF